MAKRLLKYWLMSAGKNGVTHHVRAIETLFDDLLGASPVPVATRAIA
jgi:hypothetical protein